MVGDVAVGEIHVSEKQMNGLSRYTSTSRVHNRTSLVPFAVHGLADQRFLVSVDRAIYMCSEPSDHC